MRSGRYVCGVGAWGWGCEGIDRRTGFHVGFRCGIGLDRWYRDWRCSGLLAFWLSGFLALTRGPFHALQIVRNYQEAARKKDEDLRSLVGGSYRDVLASADAIGSLAAQCQRVRGVLEGVVDEIEMEGVEGRRGTSPSASPSAPSSSSPSSSSSSLYGLASDVKTIVDAQEAVYGYVDRKEFLSAAWRYLEAVWLYRRVVGWQGLDEAGAREEGCLLLRTTQAVVDALAACGVLRPVEGVDLLGYYLEGRKAWVLAAGGVGGGDVASRVVGVMGSMWEAVGVAMEVFGEGGGGVVVGSSPSSSSSSMLVEAVRARQVHAEAASGQDGHGNHNDGDDDRGDGASTAIFDISAFEASMRVSSSLLQLENEAWLTEMAEVVRREVVVPLLETVDGCGSLRGHVERVEAVERGEGGRASSGEGMYGELTWLELSRVATGRVVSLWEMMGKEAVVSRGKAILRHALSVDVDGIVERIGSGSGSGTDDVGACEAYAAFDRALGAALAEAVECVRMDGSVFEDVVAAEFGGLMERVTRRLEARLEELEGGDLGSHREDGHSIHWTTTMLAIVRFTSLLQTRSEAYQRLLYVQHLGDAATETRDRVLLPWARETSMRVGAVRAAATRAWATACAASILGAENVEQAEQVEKTTPSFSTITPMYPSEWVTRALTRFCGALEETVSSQEDLIRQSMETFKGALVRKLRDVYSDASVTDKSRTLQRIYDATFAKVLFWEERGDANDLATNELLRVLVTSMDPVEWEEHRAAIDANVRRYTHHVASYLRTSTEIPAVGKTVDTADAGNMELAARSVRFSYLPAKLPSRPPRPTTASASSAGDLGLGIGDVTLPTSAAQEPEFFSGLQGLARVKAAEVSDLLGSFL